MSNIKDLIEKRDELFKDQTDTIMSHIAHVTDAVKTYLCDADPSYELGKFQWEDVSIFKDVDDELLMLIGIVVYEPGTQMVLGDQVVIVDEEHQDYFNRILRMGVPLSIVNQKSESAVINFLTELSSSVMGSEDLLDIDDEDHTVSIEAEEFEDNPKQVPVRQSKKSEHDFDLSELSEEQIEALRLFNLSNNKK